MRAVLRKKEPALLAVLVWFGWTLFVLVLVMIATDLVLLYGDDVSAWIAGPQIPSVRAIPNAPPPKPDF